MAPVAVDTDGAVSVSGREDSCVIAIKSLSVLVRMTGLTLRISFHLESAMVVSGDFEVRIFLDIRVTVHAAQRAVDRSPKFLHVQGERQQFSARQPCA